MQPEKYTDAWEYSHLWEIGNHLAKIQGHLNAAKDHLVELEYDKDKAMCIDFQIKLYELQEKFLTEMKDITKRIGRDKNAR